MLSDDLTEYIEPPSCRANHLLIRVQEDYGIKIALEILLFAPIDLVLYRNDLCHLSNELFAGEGTALSNLSVNLLQHSTHNVPRRDAEHLVRQGYLECEIVGDPHCSGRGQ